MITNQSNPPFISIIIPVFNKGQYLNRCFDSLIDSTFSDFEVLLVNDGSTDDSGEVCEQYQRRDKRFMVFHQLNAGVSAARNKGIDEAKGRWIYIIDPDDWIDKDAFDGLVSAIHSHPEVDFIWTYCREVHGDLVLNPDLPADIQVYTRDEFIRTDFVAGYMHSMIVRKEVIDNNKLRLSPRLDFMEDVEFIFRCVLNSGNILVYNKVFYNYLTNESSSSINLNLKKVTDHLTSATMMKQYARSYNNPAVTNHVNRQLNNQVFLYFAEIRLIKDKSIIQAREIRANLLNFIRDNSLKMNELSKLNLMLLMIGLIHIRLILAGHKLWPIVRFSSTIKDNKQ